MSDQEQITEGIGKTTPKPAKTTETETKTATSKKTSAKSGRPPVYYRQIKAKATSTQANRTVLMTVGVGAGVVLLARISGTPEVKQLNDPGDLIRIAVGSGATIIALMVVAEVTPDIAIGFGWLILVGALLAYGVPFAKALSKGTLNPGIPSAGAAIGGSASGGGTIGKKAL